jgi:hypothetical protein
VYLLLKSSDFVMSDLEMALVGGLSRTTEEEEEEEEEGGEEEEVGGNMGVKRREGGSHVVGSDGMMPPPPDFKYELVLRKWCNLHPSMEFRCVSFTMASWVSLLPLSRVKPHPNPSPNLLIPPILLCETRQWPYPSVILANITCTCNNPSLHPTTMATTKMTTTSDRYYTLAHPTSSNHTFGIGSWGGR